MKRLSSMVAILALCVNGLQPSRALANESLPADSEAYIVDLIEEYFPENSNTMIAIARCESGLQHRDQNGNLLPNQAGSSARGAFQVLMRLHAAEMRRLGLDPENDRDYMEYVRYLHQQSGLRPWDASRNCWQRAVA